MAAIKTNFRPEVDGFAFSNSWAFDPTEDPILRQLITDALPAVEILLSPFIIPILGPALTLEAGVPFIGPWLVSKSIQAANDAVIEPIVKAIEAKGYGLCGGMAFASLDYWLRNWVLPRGNTLPFDKGKPREDDQPQRTSPSGTTLRDYLWNRLIKSVQDNVVTFLEWMAILNLGGGPGATWLRDRTLDELNKLKVRIDGGTPVTIGLVGTSLNPMDNHQVLAYGYEDNVDGTCTLFIYDNNCPNIETTTRLDFRGSMLTALESCRSDDRGDLRGFFCTVYSPVVPPKTLVIRNGLTVTPLGTEIGRPVGVDFVAANIGFHTSPNIQLFAAGDSGNITEEPNSVPFNEGAIRNFNSELTFKTPGNHQIAVFADLGTFTGIHIIKQLPPEGNKQTSQATVLVLDNLRINSVVNVNRCPTAPGPNAIVKYRVDGSSAGSVIQWSVTGGTIQGSSTSSTVKIQMPATEGVIVTISVRATSPNGFYATGKLQVAVLSAEAAGLETGICAIVKIMNTFFKFPPTGPGDPERRLIDVSREDISALKQVASNIVIAANVAIEKGNAIKLSTTLQSELSINTLSNKVVNEQIFNKLKDK